MAFFSIIMPCYNSAKYLKSAVESILNQSFEDLELLVVDDNSTDGSQNILEKIAENDERLKIIRSNCKKGAGTARNQALPFIGGKYLGFMDSDDALERDFLKYAYELIVKDDSVDIYKFGAIEEYSKEDILVYKKELLPENGVYENEAMYKAAVTMEEAPLFGYLWNGIYKVSVIKEHKIKFNEEYRVNEDFLFNIDFLKNAKKMRTISKSFYHYQKRDNGLSLSTGNNKEYLKSHIIKITSFLEFKNIEPIKHKIFWLYFRMILSALERSNERKNLFKEIKQSKLYKDFLESDFSKETLKRRFTVFLFKSFPLSTVALISFVKTKFPIIFAKVKR